MNLPLLILACCCAVVCVMHMAAFMAKRLEGRHDLPMLSAKSGETNGPWNWGEFGQVRPRLLPFATDADRQWLSAFRETIEATGEPLSPCLAELLIPERLAALECRATEIYLEVMALANAECARRVEMAKQEAEQILAQAKAKTEDEWRRISAVEAFAWLRRETLKQAEAEADQIVADARKIAGRMLDEHRLEGHSER